MMEKKKPKGLAPEELEAQTAEMLPNRIEMRRRRRRRKIVINNSFNETAFCITGANNGSVTQNCA